jgi:hypothetical protein
VLLRKREGETHSWMPTWEHVLGVRRMHVAMQGAHVVESACKQERSAQVI